MSFWTCYRALLSRTDINNTIIKALLGTPIALCCIRVLSHLPDPLAVMDLICQMQEAEHLIYYIFIQVKAYIHVNNYKYKTIINDSTFKRYNST